MSNDLAALVGLMEELVADGRLSGDFESYCLLVPSELVAAWRQVAPLQRIAALDAEPRPAKVIVFEADAAARQLLQALQAERPAGAAIGFFADYYPCVVTRVFAPLELDPQAPIGSGLILFHTPRTGSHYLQSLIWNVKVFGEMEDWIRPPIIEAVRLGLVDFIEHLHRCARYQRSQAPHWSTRIEIPFLGTIWHIISPTQREAFRAMMQDSHCILLTRRNRAAQTWSMIKASVSSQWAVSRADVPPDQAAQVEVPPERLWFWQLTNIENVEEGERFVQTIARRAGATLTSVPYEDVAVPEIPPVMQTAVLGQLYEPGHCYLDPGAAAFRRQGSDADRPYVERMARLLADERGVDLREREDINALGITLSQGNLQFRPDGVHLLADAAEVRLQVGDWRGSGTIALHFRVKQEATHFPTIDLRCGDTSLFAWALDASGAYALLLDAEKVSGDVITLYVGDMQATSSADEPWPIAIRNVVRVAVPFATRPYFPWIEEVASTDDAYLCRFV